jgi:PAS domain S-box-containing protein
VLEQLSAIARELGTLNADNGVLRLLASLVSASHEFIGVADLEGNALFVNEAGLTLVGLRNLEAMRSTKVIDYFAVDDRRKVVQEVLPSVRDTGFWEGELRFRNFETGQLIPVLYNIFPLRDSSGAITAYGTVSRNLSEQKRNQEQIAVLAHEAEHRSRNVFAIVQATVALSQSDTPDGLKKAIEGRIGALANVHSLFAETRWIGAELLAIATRELAAYAETDGRRLLIGGPPVLLDRNAAQAIAVTLHELATNAAKYGALCTPKGVVALKWSHEDDGRLLLRWTETGGPTVRVPTRHGFGGRVIDRMIGQLNGKSRFNWHPEGLVCELTFQV